MGRATSVVDSPPSALVSLAKAFNQADRDVEELEQKVSVAKARRAAAEKKLVDEMVTQSIQSFRTPFGGFRSEAVVYPNVRDKEAFEAYVAKNKKKLGFLFTMHVHGGKLRSYVKELMVNGDPIPSGIEPYTTSVIRRFK